MMVRAYVRISTECKKSNEDPTFSTKHSNVKACFGSFPYNKKIAENVNYLPCN